MALLSPAQLAAGDVIFVVTIDWAGRAWRWSSAPADVTWTRQDGAAAEAVQLDGGLDELEVERSLAAISDAPDLRSVSLDLVWPADVALLVSEGHDLSTGQGELAMLTLGMDWRERVVLVAGAVSQPIYGADEEPVSLSIVEEVADDTASLLSPTQRVTLEKFPAAQQAAEGKYYPIIIGQPGLRIDRDGTSHYEPGAPALCIDYVSAANTLLVCAGRAVSTLILIVYPLGDGTWDSAGPYTIVYADDGDGNTYGYVDVSAATPALRLAGAWYSCWHLAGGVLAADGSDAVGTLGTAMLWAAQRSSIRVDLARWHAAADALPWPIGTYINEPCSPIDWVSDHLLDLAPVALTFGLGGLGPVVWRYEARRSAAVRTIRAGEGYWRSGRVEYERRPRDVRNRLTLRWARSALGDGYLEESTLTSELQWAAAGGLASIRQGATLDAMRSRSLYRLVRSEEHESDIVWSAATAWRYLHWRARADALSPRTVTYDCTTEVLEIEEGDVVVLEDAELHIDVVAQVAELVITDAGMLAVKLRILDPATSLVLVTPPYTGDKPRYGESGN